MSVFTLQTATAIVWADTTDYSSTASGLTRTAQIALASLASNAARQGDRVDLGASRAPRHHVVVGLEYAVAPAATARADLYLAFMPNETFLPAGLGASDAAYKAGEEEEWARLTSIFVPVPLTADATGTVQYIDCGWIETPDRYCIPILDNTGGQALHSDDVEMFIALIPQTHDIS